MTTVSRMHQEAGEASGVVLQQFQRNADSMRSLGSLLRQRKPRVVVTCARGSSDHAATFARYLIETQAGLITASFSPSVSSVYASRPNLADALFLVISQSGKSPDLLTATECAKASGALVVSLCNTPGSPLSRLADCAIDLHAGPETSVAATKSFIASLSAIVHLVAEWQQDQELLASLQAAPGLLTKAWQLDWTPALAVLKPAMNMFVVGRGYGLGIAQEAALKLKETCGLHAEAFSSAEVQHGPMALVRTGFPVLALSQNDETRSGIETLARSFCERGAEVLLAGGSANGARTLPVIAAHPVIEPLLMIQAFYRLAEALAIARGFNPDVPPNLRKVTETL